MIKLSGIKTIQSNRHGNNKRFAFSALLGILILAGCSPTFESKWRSSEDQPDLVNDADKNYGYDQDAGIMYHFSNSEDTLFVDLKFADRFTAMKVRRFGFTVWIDPEARKKQNYGIIFPLRDKNTSGFPSERSQLPEVVEDEDGFKRLKYNDKKKASLRSRLIKENVNLELKGFGEEFDETVLPADKAPVETKLYYDASENLSYHLAVPLDKLNIKGNLEEQVLSIGMITGKPENPNDENMRRRTPGQGGIGGISPGRNQRQQRMTSRPDMPRNMDTQLWIKKVYLASGK
ncbi:MAG: hypothetical protein ACQESX_04310 [Bacteroidota bacterium]